MSERRSLSPELRGISGQFRSSKAQGLVTTLSLRLLKGILVNAESATRVVEVDLHRTFLQVAINSFSFSPIIVDDGQDAVVIVRNVIDILGGVIRIEKIQLE